MSKRVHISLKVEDMESPLISSSYLIAALNRVLSTVYIHILYNRGTRASNNDCKDATDREDRVSSSRYGTFVLPDGDFDSGLGSSGIWFGRDQGE